MATYTDNFNRGDANDLGLSWVEREGSDASSLMILDNQLRMKSYNAWGRYGFAYWDAATGNNQYSQIVFIGFMATPGRAGVAVRIGSGGTADSATLYGAFYVPGATPKVQLHKYVDQALTGNGTLLGEYTVTLAANDIIKAEAIGTTIKVYRNGGEIISVTDSAIASGYTGIVAYGCPSSPTTGDFDNWEGGDAEAPPPSGGFHHQVMQV